MARIAVVTDSAACVPAELVRQLGINELPFDLTWNGIVYRDDEHFDADAFYARFREPHDTYPTTSQPALGAFASLYSQLSERCDGIVSIHVSARLSGALATAQLAAEQAAAVPVRLVDSRTATIAEGFVVLAAARVAAAGAGLDEVVAEAERVRGKVDFFATLKSLEHLHRGGRIGQAARLLTSRLSIVPIVNLRDGVVSVVALTRTWKSALLQIANLSIARLRGRRCVRAAAFHADALADAEWLRDQLLAQVAVTEFFLTPFTPVMGAHTGPGTVGLAFYADD